MGDHRDTQQICSHPFHNIHGKKGKVHHVHKKIDDHPRDQANLLKCMDAQIILDAKHFVGNCMDDKIHIFGKLYG